MCKLKHLPLNSAFRNSQTLSIATLRPSPPFKLTVRLWITSWLNALVWLHTRPITMCSWQWLLCNWIWLW